MHEGKPQFYGGNEMDQTVKPKPEVITLAENGLGFGEGSIGVADRLESGELTQRDTDIVREFVHSGDILVPIDYENGRMLDDDGCPDGRGTGIVQKGPLVFAKSLNRAKVFGGSATMNAVASIGVGKVFTHDMSEVFEKSSDELDESGIDYGAHSSEHCSEGECGCGAIDKFTDHVRNTEKYRYEIARTTFEVLRASGFSEDKSETDVGGMIDDSLDNFREFGHHVKPAKGQSVFQNIKDRRKVVKELNGDHNEVRIVINMIPGFTGDQDAVRQKTGGRAQVFWVDGWRMLDVIERNKFIDEDEKEQAFVAEIIYSLGVSATLTKGDLPVDLILPKKN